MSWQNLSIAVPTMVSASLVAFAWTWIEVPAMWQPSFFIGTPTLVCVLSIMRVELMKAIEDRRMNLIDPEELERFLISVKYIDHEWHDAFALTGRLREEGTALFDKINQQLYQTWGPTVTVLEGWHYKVVTEMAADSLRILDSVLSQCRSGHPDTALGTTRQLFELMMFQRVMVLDSTGKTAKSYQDVTEIRYLDDEVELRGSTETWLTSDLRRLREQYAAGTNTKPSRFSWITLPDGKSPRSMEQVVEYVIDSWYPRDERESALKYYMHQWAILNNWVHISKSASKRKLGTRTPDGYVRAHLLEKSRVGLESPLSLSVSLFQSMLVTLEYTACKVTHTRYHEDLQGIAETVNDIGVSFRSVPSELLANDFRL